MTKITPGYDFQPTEVPTREKFLEQARSLRVTELDQQILDANFGSILTADASGATGGSAQTNGSLWVDPAGNVWAEYGRGPLRLWRADGGWEFNRYDYLVGQGSTTPEHGFGGDFGGGVSENAAIPRAQPAVYQTGAGISLFVNADTAFSGGTRLLGRGVVLYGIEAAQATIDDGVIYDQTQQLRINGVTVGTYWAVEDLSSGDHRMFDGWFGGLAVDSSTASQAGDDHLRNAVYGYFTQRIWGPGTNP